LLPESLEKLQVLASKCRVSIRTAGHIMEFMKLLAHKGKKRMPGLRQVRFAKQILHKGCVPNWEELIGLYGEMGVEFTHLSDLRS